MARLFNRQSSAINAEAEFPFPFRGVSYGLVASETALSGVYTES